MARKHHSLFPPTPPAMMEECRCGSEKGRKTHDSAVSLASLSALPTPPISYKCTPAQGDDTSACGTARGTLRGPAEYLSNLVRPSDGIRRPRSSDIEAMLSRANLDKTTIAFAACLLERLSWRFVREWKRAIDKASQHLSWRNRSTPSADLIVLAALYTSSCWLVDEQYSQRVWLDGVGQSQFGREALEMTQRSILLDPQINGRLLDIREDEVREIVGILEDL